MDYANLECRTITLAASVTLRRLEKAHGKGPACEGGGAAFHCLALSETFVRIAKLWRLEARVVTGWAKSVKTGERHPHVWVEVGNVGNRMLYDPKATILDMARHGDSYCDYEEGGLDADVLPGMWHAIGFTPDALDVVAEFLAEPCPERGLAQFDKGASHG